MMRRQLLGRVSALGTIAIAGCAGGDGATGGETSPTSTETVSGYGSDGDTPTETATPTPTATETATPTPTEASSGGVTTVVLEGYSFRPVEASVDPGGTVEWVNQDRVGHDVTATTFNDAAADWEFSKTLGPNASVSHTFETAGAYEYYCTIHGESTMCGVVLVGDASPAGPLPCR